MAVFSTTFLPLLEETAGQVICHVLLSGCIEVAVNVGSHFDVSVSHPFLHIFQSEALIQQETGAAVPEIMEANERQMVLL